MSERMKFTTLENGPRNRCGRCMNPYRAHRPRISAAPSCPDGGGGYREATEEELAVAYQATFPGGPKPIASFDLNNPDDVARARNALSPETLSKFFGPGGGGMAEFMDAMENGAGHDPHPRHVPRRR